MNYPLISEYIEAIRSAEDNFDKLSYLRPILDNNGDPVMSSGNFAVVFKMKEINTEKFFAVKCFIKEQEGRGERYEKITEELEFVSSPYLLHVKYLERELFVSTSSCDEEYPILVMDWVEGQPLDVYLKQHIHDTYELQMLAYRFCKMGAWLLSQPFAHGDLKPDNIIVRKDGTLVLVDYDGMFVPSMNGETASEIGTPDFRHPLRTEKDFDEHIDDLAIASIALSLKAISLNTQLYNEYAAPDRLLFSATDYCDIGKCKAFQSIAKMASEVEIAALVSTFLMALAKNNLNMVSFRTLLIDEPAKPLSTKITDDEKENAVRDGFCALYTADGLKLIKGSDLGIATYSIKQGTLIIGDNAFLGCKSLQAINIPDSVTTIGYSAFSGCKSLESINIPDSVTTIGYSAFSGCKSLKSINIPDNVTTIGAGAFYGCESLQAINLPDSVTTIGDGVFAGCFSLKDVVVLGENFYTQDDMLISSHGTLIACWSRATDLNIPDSVTTIGAGAFYDCKSRQSFNIPDSVTPIRKRIFLGSKSLKSINILDELAFFSCKSLKSIHLPDSVTTIGNEAFNGCKSLQAINIPDSVTTIGNKAFSGCKSLQTINLPDSVTTIGYEVFCGCESLQAINLPDSVTTIGDEVFCGCESLQAINIPDSVTTIGYGIFEDCSSLKDVVVSGKNFYTQNDMLISSHGTLIACWSRATDLNIPDGVTTIREYAFLGCESLKSINIPDSVTTIGYSAFSGCKSLQSINIPDSVTTIEKWAFSGCKSLQAINIPQGTKKKFLQMLGEYTDYTYKLKEI